MTTTTASEAGDDDVEEADNGPNDGLQNGANAVHNGHQAVANCAEDGFNLYRISRLERWIGKWVWKLTQETTAPILRRLVWWRALEALRLLLLGCRRG
jgi:hypothetical protein